VNRTELVNGLLYNEEQCHERFVSGDMDRDTWTKELEDIDAKLSVLGLRLGFRPWEGTVTLPKTGRL
jgi:hypothetical protein